MSRSYRKAPICGVTTAASDKTFKKAAHRRTRRANNVCDLWRDGPPMDKEFGNPWCAPKDGKQWIDAERFPEFTRK